MSAKDTERSMRCLDSMLVKVAIMEAAPPELSNLIAAPRVPHNSNAHVQPCTGYSQLWTTQVEVIRWGQWGQLQFAGFSGCEGLRRDRNWLE